MKRFEFIVVLVLLVILLGPVASSANRGMINIGPDNVPFRECRHNADLAQTVENQAIIQKNLKTSGPSLVPEGLKLALENCEKAKILFTQGMSAESLTKKETYYTDALKLCPRFAEAHNNLGDVYEKQGRYQDAIKEYGIASALAPSAPPPYFGLGDIYFKLGRFPTAIVYYEKALKIEADDKSAAERLRLSRILTTSILFRFDSCQLTDKATNKLKLIAEALSSPEFEDCIFEIQGHTDSTGPEDYNLRLSQRRTEGIRKYLVEKGGLTADRLTARGYGEDRPVTSNATKQGRRQNRRVEVNRFLRRH